MVCRRGGAQISTTASASRPWLSEKSGATLRARSTKRLTAAEPMPEPTSSDGTRHNCSSPTPSPSRLVAKNVTVADCGEDGLDQISGGVQNVLAVVEHQQSDSALQRGSHRLGDASCLVAE